MTASPTNKPLTRVAQFTAFALFLGLPLALVLLDIFTACEARYLFLASLGAYFGYGIVLSGLMFVISRKALVEISLSGPPSPGTASLTLAIPAFNEAKTISACINSVLAQTSVPDQIIVVNDGSQDDTIEILVHEYDMKAAPSAPGGRIIRSYHSRSHPQLHLLDCSHAGKASALNTALIAAEGELFITLDADSVLARDALARLSARMMSDPDGSKVIAAGGIVQPANGLSSSHMASGTGGLPKGLLVRLQWIEYATGFVWRFGWSFMNTLLLVSGSFSGFRTEPLKTCGGFDPDSLTEDYEVAYRLHEYCRRKKLPYVICTAPDALAFTLAPETIPTLFAQRIRWFQGFLQTLISYRRLVLNPAYGWLGVFMLPVKAMDALVPLWGLYLYVMLAVNAFSERVSLPVSLCFVAALIFGRLAIETLSGWALLYLREHYIRPRLGFRQNLIAASLVPLNALFHRILWLAYSLTAHWRLVTRRRRRRIMGRRGFQGA